MGFPTTLSSVAAAPVLCELTPEMEHPHLLRGLVGAWSPCLKQYGGGTTLFDLSGRGNHGTLTNMDPATVWQSGSRGAFLSGDAVNDFVSFPSFSGIGSGSFTLFCWVEMTTNVVTYLVNRDGSTSPRCLYRLYTSPNWNVVFDMFAGASVPSVATPATFMYNKGPVAICAVRDISSNTISLYCNGVLASTAAGLVSNLEAGTGAKYSTFRENLSGATNAQNRLYDLIILQRPATQSDAALHHCLGPGGWATPRRRRIYAPQAAAPPAGNRSSFKTLALCR